ncbi:MAG: hypothetical protein E6K18_06000 [Methanobacteriota archaeon]|nr:MAG: hypothetical protein E6K18_06000 [Euryarchaeota archaeon]
MTRALRLVSVCVTIGVLAVSFAPLARAGMTLPPWHVGDWWTYSTGGAAPPGTLRIDVVGTEVMTISGIPYLSYRTTSDYRYAFGGVWLNMTGPSWWRVSDLALVRQMLNGTFEQPPVFSSTLSLDQYFDPPQTLQWPLAAGASWTSSGWVNTSQSFGGTPPTYNNYSTTTTFSVRDDQSVTVPAGTFMTSPVNASSSGYSNVTYWSPAVGNAVLIESFDSTGAPLGGLQLTAYRYTGAAPDTTPPTISAVAATPPTQTAGGTVTISATVVDDVAVAQVIANVTQPDGSYVSRAMTPLGGDAYSYEQGWNQVGSYSFLIIAIDTSQNIRTAPGSFLVTAPDTTGPTISAVAATPPIQVVGGTVTISATITDPSGVAGVILNVTQPDGSPVSRAMTAGAGNSYSYGQTWDQVGVHPFTIYAWDALGNPSTASGSFATRAPDTTPPTISHTPPGSVFIGDTIRIEASVSDDVGVQSVRLVFTPVGGQEQNVTMALSGGAYTYAIPAQASAGTVHYRIYAVDTSGNARLTQEYSVTVHARAAPVGVGPIELLLVALVAAVIVAVLLVALRRRKKRAEAPPTAPPNPPQSQG